MRQQFGIAVRVIVVDQCIGNMLCRTKGAYEKAVVWSRSEEEFVRRAGYAMMAYLAVHDKAGTDGKFLEFLSIIEQDSIDERNFVKKAVNWALRQIGKRNQASEQGGDPFGERAAEKRLQRGEVDRSRRTTRAHEC